MKIAPLKSSFMVTGIIGFFVSVLLIYPASPSFGVAFSIVFATMFIASIISMTYSPIEEAAPRDFDRGFSLHVSEDKSLPTLAKPKKRGLKKKVTKKPKKVIKKKAAKKVSKKKTAKSTKKKASRKKRR